MNLQVRPYLLVTILLAMAISTPSHAALVSGNVGEIVGVFTFSEVGSGDVVIEVQTPLATCQNGFWLRATDPGFKAMYAYALTVHTAKLTIRATAYDDQIWTGSAGRYCRVYLLGTSW